MAISNSTAIIVLGGIAGVYGALTVLFAVLALWCFCRKKKSGITKSTPAQVPPSAAVGKPAESLSTSVTSISASGGIQNGSQLFNNHSSIIESKSSELTGQLQTVPVVVEKTLPSEKTQETRELIVQRTVSSSSEKVDISQAKNASPVTHPRAPSQHSKTQHDAGAHASADAIPPCVVLSPHSSSSQHNNDDVTAPVSHGEECHVHRLSDHLTHHSASALNDIIKSASSASDPSNMQPFTVNPRSPNLITPSSSTSSNPAAADSRINSCHSAVSRDKHFTTCHEARQTVGDGGFEEEVDSVFPKSSGEPPVQKSRGSRHTLKSTSARIAPMRFDSVNSSRQLSSSVERQGSSCEHPQSNSISIEIASDALMKMPVPLTQNDKSRGNVAINKSSVTFEDSSKPNHKILPPLTMPITATEDSTSVSNSTQSGPLPKHTNKEKSKSAAKEIASDEPSKHSALEMHPLQSRLKHKQQLPPIHRKGHKDTSKTSKPVFKKQKIARTESTKPFIELEDDSEEKDTAGHVDAGSHGNRQAGNVVDKLILPGNLSEQGFKVLTVHKSSSSRNRSHKRDQSGSLRQISPVIECQSETVHEKYKSGRSDLTTAFAEESNDDRDKRTDGGLVIENLVAAAADTTADTTTDEGLREKEPSEGKPNEGEPNTKPIHGRPSLDILFDDLIEMITGL